MKWFILCVVILLTLIGVATALFQLGYGAHRVNAIWLGWKMAALEYSGAANKGEMLPYRLYAPELSEDGDEKIPLVVVLQGAHGRGVDNKGQLTPAVAAFVDDDFQDIQKSYVVAPQCPIGKEWNDARPSSPPYTNISFADYGVSWRQKLLKALIEDLTSKYPIDRSRIYLTGSSMGGTGTWDTIYRYPDLFAAAVPLNGRSDPSVAKELVNTPVWIFHGENDRVAPVKNSIVMNKALLEAGASPILTVIPNAGHEITAQSYSKELFKWVLQQRRTF